MRRPVAGVRGRGRRPAGAGCALPGGALRHARRAGAARGRPGPDGHRAAAHPTSPPTRPTPSRSSCTGPCADRRTRDAAVDALRRRLSALDGVDRVDAPTGRYVDGARSCPADATLAGLPAATAPCACQRGARESSRCRPEGERLVRRGPGRRRPGRRVAGRRAVGPAGRHQGRHRRPPAARRSASSWWPRSSCCS